MTIISRRKFLPRTILHSDYDFKDHDPIIDAVRTLVSDAGKKKTLNEVADTARVARSTLINWFNGTTKQPKFATVMRVVRSLGGDIVVRGSDKKMIGLIPPSHR